MKLVERALVAEPFTASDAGATRIVRVTYDKVFVPLHRENVWSAGVRPGTTRLLVRVETADGTVGYGETICLLEFVEPVLRRTIIPLALGEDAFDIERLVRKVEGAGYYHHKRAMVAALAGLEMALWDIVGKKAGLPLYKLWGGAFRRDVPMIAYLMASTNRIVPTAEQRAGDFRNVRDAAGNVIAIYDPLTTRPDPAKPGSFIRDQISCNGVLNVICPNRINPVAAEVLKFYPQATDPAARAGTVSNPFPNGILQPPGSSQGALTGLGTPIEGNERTTRRGVSHQWNMNVQRELAGGLLVEVGYIGNRGLYLPATFNFDILPQANLALGTQLQQQLTNPFFGLIPSSLVLGRATVPRSELLTTYPQFAGVTGLGDWASSIYHAGTLKVEKRFARGLSLLTAYTWSKLIDSNDGSGDFNQSNFYAGGNNRVQNWENLRAERSISSNDLPLVERVRLEFRAEFFNFTNHPVFAAPNGNFSSPDFGRLTNTLNSPRQIQFGLKLIF